MNRPLLVSLVILLGGVALCAQPMLDDKTLPSTSRSEALSFADTTGVRPGPGGPSVMWNFSQLRPRSGSDYLLDHLLPQETLPEFRALFPLLEVSVKSDTIQGAFQRLPSSFRMLGATSPSADMVVSGSDPYDTRPIEIVYDDVFKDQFKAVITVRASGQTLARSGNHTLHYDGFGTLVLPHKQFDGVARTTDTLVTSDTLRAGPNTIIVSTTSVTTIWLQTISPIPLLVIETSRSTATRNGSPLGTPVVTKTVYMNKNTNSTSVDVSPIGVEVWPVPSTQGSVFIRLNSNDVDGITMINALGSSVTMIAYSELGQGVIQCDLGNAPAGSYQLLVHKRVGAVDRRLIAIPILILN